jgi:hypothetical protein
MNTKMDTRTPASDSESARGEIRAMMVEDQTNALEGMKWLLSDSDGFKNAVTTFISAKEGIEIIDSQGLAGLCKYLKIM